MDQESHAWQQYSDCCYKPLAAVPDLAALQQLDTDYYPFLLASAASNKVERWSLLLAAPQQQLLAQSQAPAEFWAELEQDFLAQKKSKKTASNENDLPPFRGGWFLYLAYEMAQAVEPTLHLPQQENACLPLAAAIRVPAAIAVDHLHNRAWLVVETDQQNEQVPRLLQDCQQTLNQAHISPSPWPHIQLQEDDPQAFLQAVEAVRQHIYDGDIFQANISRAWQGQAEQAINPYQLWRKLSNSNPAPHAGMAYFASGAVLSSSPERLVSVRGRQVSTRPIAGTRPRNADPVADAALQAQLLAHPKEQAEHVMLIDLERNDLGRVAVPGTVIVDELMVLESYAHVHHIVSNVSAQLRAGVSPIEVIKAVFPGGTITGCPKVRCMQIIADVEGVGRGAYTGAMGYLNRDGDMDLNILIRTISVTGQQLNFRAGAGIVADSVPEWELKETRAKARGMLLALQ